MCWLGVRGCGHAQFGYSCLLHAWRKAQTDMPAVQVNLDAVARGGGVADICMSCLPGWMAVRASGRHGRVEQRVWAASGLNSGPASWPCCWHAFLAALQGQQQE